MDYLRESGEAGRPLWQLHASREAELVAARADEAVFCGYLSGDHRWCGWWTPEHLLGCLAAHAWKCADWPEDSYWCASRRAELPTLRAAIASLLAGDKKVRVDLRGAEVAT